MTTSDSQTKISASSQTHHIKITKHLGSYTVDPPRLDVGIGDTVIISVIPPDQNVIVFFPEPIFEWVDAQGNTKAENIVPIDTNLTVKGVGTQSGDNRGIFSYAAYDKETGIFIGAPVQDKKTHSQPPVIIIYR